MLTKLILPAALAAIAISTWALPASAIVTPLSKHNPLPLGKATMVECQQLMKQFDDEYGLNPTLSSAAEAKKLRASGETQCKAGSYEAGIRDLRVATDTMVSSKDKGK